MKLKSLKTNILLYLILFTSIPLISGSSMILYQMYVEKKESIFHTHFQILKQVINESDQIIEDIENISLYIKENYNSKNKNLLESIVKTQDNITTVLILDNNGILKDFKSVVKANIFKGFDYSNMPYFKALKNGEEEYWSDVYLSNATGLASLSYTIRFDDNTIAVLVINLDYLNSFASKFKSSDNTTMVQIVDNNGVYLANPDSEETVYQRKSIVGTNIYKNFILKDYINKQILFNDTQNIKIIGTIGKTNKLNWTIIVEEQYDFIFSTFKTLIYITILFMILLIIISIYFSLKLSKSILKPLNLLSHRMDDIAHGKDIEKISEVQYSELDSLSSNFYIMQNKIKDREESNRQKELQILDSSKMAQMGEMIGNIAHQWRQPLSIISTAASGMKLEKEYGILEDDKFIYYCDSIVEKSKYLSETIDIFRNFIKEKKQRAVVIIQDRIDTSLKIVIATLEANYIQLINNIDYSKPIKIELVMGELSQVIINLINNAKDILLERKIKNAWIKIDLVKDKDFVTITVEDNAGGVPEEIMGKIFDPYFTTKHKSQGTGLGLHMSYKIVHESLYGKLSVKNTENGASFIIVLPLIKHKK
ncbi:MAG: sensor histidine kinase [Campylobacterota bacterium]|nr:sensor histidine kinase [Campylobacterota bacterium]